MQRDGRRSRIPGREKPRFDGSGDRPPPPRTLRGVAVGLSLSLAALLALELGARGLLALAPGLGDPFAGREGAAAAGDPIRLMEDDLAVVSRRQRLYVPDRELFWRLAPNVEMEVENSVLEPRDAPILWKIRTNEYGFRGGPPGEGTGLRILNLGDSVTFGFRVAEDEAYPARLRAACRAGFALNAGVPGYTSHQGKLLAEKLIAAFDPDVVTIAFGANDRETDRLADAERSAWLDSAGGRVTFEVQRSGLHRVFSALAARAEPAAETPLRRRVEVDEYRANVEAMIDSAQRAGARVVLLDLVYVGPVYRDALRALAASRDLPLVDGRALLDQAYDGIESGAAYREEAEAWRRFYSAHVLATRRVYFDRAFYAQHYATERQQQQFMTLMADPIHPNGLGHRVLADALVPLVCPAAPG